LKEATLIQLPFHSQTTRAANRIFYRILFFYFFGILIIGMVSLRSPRPKEEGAAGSLAQIADPFDLSAPSRPFSSFPPTIRASSATPQLQRILLSFSHSSERV